MSRQIQVPARARTGATRIDGVHAVAADVAYARLTIVNVVFVGPRHAADRGWVLVDTGTLRSPYAIAKAAAARFGRGARPAAIVLTHGHFDHVGGVAELAKRWEVPVYAHALELPHLDGTRSYPPADPRAGGGMMARFAPLYPRGPIDVGRWLRPLPEDGTVPAMPGWRALHTPGHTVGHVALWREHDGTLLSGDAVVSTDAESLWAILSQRAEVHGPPQYFTSDWYASRDSLDRFVDLEPEVLVTGHGPALRGPAVRAALHALARSFDPVALPRGVRLMPRRRREAATPVAR